MIAEQVRAQLALRRIYKDQRRAILINLSRGDAEWLVRFLPRPATIRVRAVGEGKALGELRAKAIALAWVVSEASRSGHDRRGRKYVWPNEMRSMVANGWALSVETTRRYRRTLRKEEEMNLPN